MKKYIQHKRRCVSKKEGCFGITCKGSELRWGWILPNLGATGLSNLAQNRIQWVG